MNETIFCKSIKGRYILLKVTRRRKTSLDFIKGKKLEKNREINTTIYIKLILIVGLSRDDKLNVQQIQ